MRRTSGVRIVEWIVQKTRRTVECVPIPRGSSLSLRRPPQDQQRKGKFSHVDRIDDVLGNYLAASGNVGAGKAGTAQALTKGKVSLMLAGRGDGFDIGVAINDFKIMKGGPAK